jgi:23S rRNA (adenine2030-N6)-methyltransferase
MYINIYSMIIEYLKQKEAPFFALDAYAGRGFYDLTGPQALQTTEFKFGIGALLSRKKGMEGFETYLSLVNACNGEGGLKYYPGSPEIARRLLRPQDRLGLIELHPAEIGELRAHFKRVSRVEIHERDALEGLVALVPPKEKRGVILLDPSYEVKMEYVVLPEQLAHAYAKWPTGVYMIWYPLLAAGYQVPLLRALKAIPQGSSLLVHEIPNPQGATQNLQGSGIAIINPPWVLEKMLKGLQF